MLRMKNGDYVPKGSGLETVSGSEAVLQRVLLRLTARRGAFPFMESFGSRLWTLGQLKAAERQAAAEQYVADRTHGGQRDTDAERGRMRGADGAAHCGGYGTDRRGGAAVGR